MANHILDWVKRSSWAFAWISRLYGYLSELEDEREIPQFTARRKPEIFRGQRVLLVTMIEELGTASTQDFHLRAVRERLGLDIASVVLSAMRKAGLACSNQDDLLYLGLLILYARHRGAPEMASFYGHCIARYFAGKPLTLARYRESRDYHSIKVWFVFEGEPPDSPAWKPPKWKG